MANNVRCCFSLLQNITVILFLKVESQYFCAYLFTTVNPSPCYNKYHSINRFPRIKNAAPRILKALKLLYGIWLRGETSRNFQQRLYKQTNFRWRVSVVQVLFVWIIIIIIAVIIPTLSLFVSFSSLVSLFYSFEVFRTRYQNVFICAALRSLIIFGFSIFG